MLTGEMMRENWSRQVPGETVAANIQVPSDAHGELYWVGRTILGTPVGSWKRNLEREAQSILGSGLSVSQD